MPEVLDAPPAPPTKPTSPPPIKSPPSPPKQEAEDDSIERLESDDPFKDAFAEIDKEAGEETQREEKRNARQEKSDKTPDDKSKTNGDIKPNSEKPKEEEPKTNKELREVYTALKEKVSKEYEPKIKELETLRSENKQLKSRDETSSKALQDENAALKKANQEMEGHLRFSAYKQTKEYKDHESALNNEWASAMRKLGGISISRTDPTTEETTERELTIDDLARYARLDPRLLWKELKTEIPDAAERTTVINHVQKIQDLSETLFKAEEKAKADSENHAKTQTETQRQSQLNRAKLWKDINEAIATKYPKMFGKDESDAEGNVILDKGRALTDLLFDPASLTQERIQLLPKRFKEAIESSKPFSPEDHARLHAIIANKAANHDRAVTRLKAAQTRIAELEKSLKEYEDSGPDSVRVGGTRKAKDAPLTADEEFDAIARG